MKVFKFGGASVKDADAVRNVARVIRHFPDEQVLVVVSAMGKTTNALEAVWKAWVKEEPIEDLLDGPLEFHLHLIDQLFESGNPLKQEVQHLFNDLGAIVALTAGGDHNRCYSQVVAFGELLSTKIVSAFLEQEGLENAWLDAREIVKTSSTWRDANVDWRASAMALKAQGDLGALTITQGFIGSDDSGQTTTLGREGSDFSAAIFAYLLDAESVTIWKDVQGMFNADPNKFDDTVLLPKISYREAIELSYFGASVIHPKTVKPLQNKDIPLYVRSFQDVGVAGSEIQSDGSEDHLVPSYIFKPDQMLISITPRDLSFIVESHLSDIFSLFAQASVKIELMQNSALSFSVCVDDTERAHELIQKLRLNFEVRYNDGLELVTIRHYNEATLDELSKGRELILEQRSRSTARLVLR